MQQRLPIINQSTDDLCNKIQESKQNQIGLKKTESKSNVTFKLLSDFSIKSLETVIRFTNLLIINYRVKKIFLNF